MGRWSRPRAHLPRWSRPSIRWRLTAWYAAIFLVLGMTLLAVSYAVVSRTLGPDASHTPIVYRITGAPATETRTGGDDATFTLRAGTGDHAVLAAQRAFEAAERERARRGLNRVLTDFLLALAALTVASLGAGWVVAGRVLAPIERITGTARRVSRERLHERIALVGPPDELKELADTFDDMLERLDAAFDSQRRFVANASHELQTPLAVIRAELDEALDDPASSPDVRGLARELRVPADRSTQLIASLLTLAQSETPLHNPTPVDVGAVASMAAESLRERAAQASIALHVDAAPAVVHGDHVLLEQMLRNLLENALRYNRARGGWVEVVVLDERGLVRIVVANSGPVVAADRVEELWQPFRRLERSRSRANGGFGLGLSIVRAVADAHDGYVTARPRAEGGLVVEVRLPAGFTGPGSSRRDRAATGTC